LVVELAFGRDDKTLSVLSAQGDSIAVQRWQLTGATPRPLSAGLQFRSSLSTGVRAALSSDGSKLIVVEQKGLELWNLTASQRAGTRFGPANASTVQFSANGAYVAVTVGNDTQVWNVTTKSPYGQRIQTDGNLWELSPDGTTLAVADQLLAVELWNTTTGGSLGVSLASGEATFGLAFSADGGILATTGAAGVQLWDIAASLPIGGLLSTDDTPTSVAFDPTGTELATASDFPGGATASAEPVAGPAQLWEVSPLTPAQAARAVCAQTHQTLSQPQWIGFATGAPYLNVCPSNSVG
jgi:WD40 repeat protein